MISVPVAVYNSSFEWQLDLFWKNHMHIYGDDAKSKAKAIVIRRNRSGEHRTEKYAWKIDLPHKLCESFFDCGLGIPDDGHLLPLNIQIGLMQILGEFKDDQIIELLDCDMFHIKRHPDLRPKHGEMIVSDVYEKWHLHSKGENRHVLEKYIGASSTFYNGGFVPIIATASTFKAIILDWIWMHRDIVRRYSGAKSIRWWAGMFSLQSACEINGIKMSAMDTCYIPNINQLNDKHHVAHYSCDPIFNKKKYPAINVADFPENIFYTRLREWIDTPRETMTRAQLDEIFQRYLERKPNESDIKFHQNKRYQDFEKEIAICPERKSLESKRQSEKLWKDYEMSPRLTKKQVKIAVGTNKNFHASTLPVILNSLIDAGIDKRSIVVFNAGYSSRKSTKKDGIKHIELDHNSFENSALIEIAEHEMESDYWFYLHDTCKVGPKFLELLLAAPSGAEKVALRKFPSMSIGLYAYKYIIGCREMLAKIVNRDYSPEALMREKLWGIPNEDYILWLNSPETTLVYPNASRQVVDSSNWFGTETKRITEYHPQLDLYKSKSNWHAYQGRNLSL